MLFTEPICDEFLQLNLLNAEETFLAFHLGKRVETSDRIKVELTKQGKVLQVTDISMLYSNFPIVK